MLCNIYKWLITRIKDTNLPLTGFLRRHLDRCPKCETFFASIKAIDTDLQNQAADLPTFDISTINARIIDALPDHTNRKRTAHPHPIWILKPARLSAVAACLIIVAVGTFHIKQQQRKEQFIMATEFFDSIERFTSQITTDRPQPNSFSSLLRNPMAAEMNNLTKDAGNAANFLISCVDCDIATGQ